MSTTETLFARPCAVSGGSAIGTKDNPIDFTRILESTAPNLSPFQLGVRYDRLKRKRSKVLREPYAQIRCLLLRWEEDELESDVEIEGLATVLQQKLDCQIEKYQIPSKDSQRTLDLRIRQFIGGDNLQNELLIVYYCGHGWEAPNGRLQWHAGSLGEPTPSLYWSNIQDSVLMPLNKDVLIILDCCSAASAFRSIRPTRKDILAACNKLQLTPSRPHHTYTDCLSKVLQSFTKPFTPADMQAKLRAALGEDFGSVPCHRAYPASDGHEIVLVPREHHGSIKDPHSNPRSWITMNMPFKRKPDKDDLVSWFLDMAPLPRDTLRCKIITRANSYSVTLSTPLHLWSQSLHRLLKYRAAKHS